MPLPANMRQGVGVDSMKVLGIQGEGLGSAPGTLRGRERLVLKDPLPFPCPYGPMTGSRDYHVPSSLGIPKVPTGP